MGRFKKNTFVLLILFVLLAGVTRPNVLADRLFQPEISYNLYLANYSGAVRPQKELIIPALTYRATDMEIQVLEQLQGVNKAVLTEEEGYIEWEVEVAEAGLYNIALNYYPIVGKGNPIERELLINGILPFEEAKYLAFQRIWGDAEEIKVDNQGNELYPLQQEFPFWQEAVLADTLGYYREPFKFYFRQGLNTIRLVSRQEPLALAELKVFQLPLVPTYQEVSRQYREYDSQQHSGVMIKLQERDSSYRSSSVLYPQFDQGDPTMEPYHPVLIRLNSIGGGSWDQLGQWISWDFQVPADGFYKIAIKGKQAFQRGSYVNRQILLNGQLPFRELEAVRFPYSRYYRLSVLGAEGTDEPYLFYLTKGNHRITLQVVLGDLVDVIRKVEDSLYQLNNLYRQIIMITSTVPDPLRTYQLGQRIPELRENLVEQSRVLAGIARELEDYTGQKGGNTVLLLDFSRQLQGLAAQPESIPGRLGQFRDNLASLGSWLLGVRRQPLAIDYLIIASPEVKLPEVAPTAQQLLNHESKAFVASFTHNYNLVGNVYQPEGTIVREPLRVWAGFDRSKAQILKRLIENKFTPETGIPVNLEIIDIGTLLPATLAGKNPDVAIGLPPGQPLNFALRGAVADLSQFADFAEVARRFKTSALVPFMFRDSVYALPEQQPFPMLFYRKDVLQENGLTVPETWDDVMEIIPELQKNNMEFGFPFSAPPRVTSLSIGNISGAVGSLSSSGGVLTLVTFLNQSGEELFIEDGLATNFDDERAIAAFTRWTELYELYNLPLLYNPANRFRTGEMPILITGYTFYNLLTVFAPELRGKWDFTLVPGTVRTDQVIDRSIPAGAAGMADASGRPLPPASGPGTVIMELAQDKTAAWEFLKWWTSAATQVSFGRQLESLMGPAARYPTANLEALSLLPWSARDYQKLSEQLEWVKGVPEIPGGYLIGRYLDNAFRQVVYYNKPARDTLLDYNYLINEEITRKRKEFGLPVSLAELEEKWHKLYWQQGF